MLNQSESTTLRDILLSCFSKAARPRARYKMSQIYSDQMSMDWPGEVVVGHACDSCSLEFE